MGCLLVGDANVILFYSILFDSIRSLDPGHPCALPVLWCDQGKRDEARDEARVLTAAGG
jgi:hypothetical protein